MGLESISAALLNKVTHYHAQIGHNVDKSKLYELEYKLLQDAKNLYHSHHWEDALNTFAQVRKAPWTARAYAYHRDRAREARGDKRRDGIVVCAAQGGAKAKQEGRSGCTETSPWEEFRRPRATKRCCSSPRQ